MQKQPTAMKQRRHKGEVYWYLSFDNNGGTHPVWRALSAREMGDLFDNRHWEEGNYYTDLGEAQKEAGDRNEEARIIRDLELVKEKEKEVRQKPLKRKRESEKDVERYLVNKSAANGWLPLKYTSGITTGYPDRCILLPGGRTVWVEVKTTGEKPTRLQRIRLRQLEELGFLTAVVDSRKLVDELIGRLQAPAS